MLLKPDLGGLEEELVPTSPIERVVKDCVVRENVTIEPGVAVLKTQPVALLTSHHSKYRPRVGFLTT